MKFYVKDPAGELLPARPTQIIAEAARVAPRVYARRKARTFTSPRKTREYLLAWYGGQEHETFDCHLLDNRHRLITSVRLFRGTIDGCSVHPREVVKLALECNASAVIFSHNHPSGDPEPSRADELITRRLRDALALVDVRVLDSMIAGATKCVSLAERGLI